MDEHRLRSLFARLSEEAVEPTRTCPDLNVLAAYAEGRLGERESEHFERHLADCAHCLGQVRFLVRSEPRATARAEAASVTDASPLEGFGRRAKRWFAPPRQPALVALAAASLLLAGVVTIHVVDSAGRMRQMAPAEESVGAPPGRAVRKLTPPATRGVSRPEITFPREGDEVARRDLVLAWQSVPEALSYTVRLVDAAGAPVWEDQTETISTTVPADVGLVAGERYYVWVAVSSRSGSRQRSPAVGFRLAPE